MSKEGNLQPWWVFIEEARRVLRRPVPPQFHANNTFQRRRAAVKGGGGSEECEGGEFSREGK